LPLLRIGINRRRVRAEGKPDETKGENYFYLMSHEHA